MKLWEEYDSCYPFLWCIWAFDFAIWLETFRFEFSSEFSIFRILLFTLNSKIKRDPKMTSVKPFKQENMLFFFSSFFIFFFSSQLPLFISFWHILNINRALTSYLPLKKSILSFKKYCTLPPKLLAIITFLEKNPHRPGKD